VKAETILERGGAVARSLRITGATHLMVAAISGAMALNGMLAALALGFVGEVVVIFVVFVSLAGCSAAISVDVLNRSGKAVADLRSIGASRGNISMAIFGSNLIYGALGAVLGGAIGAGMGFSLMGGAFGTQAVVDLFAVVVASAAALAAGSYAGGRMTWRS
jgi:hypothetical protein